LRRHEPQHSLRDSPDGVPIAYAVLGATFASDIIDLASTHWDAFIELLALRMVGWNEGGRLFGERLKKKWTEETFNAYLAAIERLDGWPAAQRVQCETLVITLDEDMKRVRQAAQTLSAVIPRGHLAVQKGGVILHPDQIEPIEAFLDDFTPDAQLSDRRRRTSNDALASGSIESDDGLSQREVEVLRLLGQGRTNQQIAGELVITLSTVSHHMTNIFTKIGAANRTEAAAYAYRRGLL
jgi:DNA-binding NarL/FixJ family response regulator